MSTKKKKGTVQIDDKYVLHLDLVLLISLISNTQLLGASTSMIYLPFQNEHTLEPTWMVVPNHCTT